MSGLAEVLIGGGILAVLGATLGFNQWSAASGLKKRLYRDDGITVFLPRKEAEQMESRIVKKIDELKTLIESTDRKRENVKEETQLDLRQIDSRLSGIEAQLETKLP